MAMGYHNRRQHFSWRHPGWVEVTRHLGAKCFLKKKNEIRNQSEEQEARHHGQSVEMVLGVSFFLMTLSFFVLSTRRLMVLSSILKMANCLAFSSFVCVAFSPLSLQVDTCHETFSQILYFIYSVLHMYCSLLYLDCILAKGLQDAKISNCYAIMPHFLSFLPFIQWNFHS